MDSDSIAFSALPNDTNLEFAINCIPTGMLIIDETGTIDFANHALETMFGYEDGALTGLNILQLIPDKFRKHHPHLMKGFFETGTTSLTSDNYQMAAGRTIPALRKNGESFPVQINLNVRRYKGKKFAFATIFDQQEKESQTLRYYEEGLKIRRAIQATHHGIWEWNIQTNEVWYSPQFKKMIGLPPSEGGCLEDWQNSLHPDDRPQMETAFHDHLYKRHPFEVKYRSRQRNGSYQWMIAHGEAIFDEKGKPTLMSGILSNINERQLLEEQLDQNQLFLNNVLDGSLAGLYIMNILEKRNSFINQAYTKITGYTQQDLDAIQAREGSLDSLFHPEDLSKLTIHIENLKKMGLSQSEEFLYRFKHKAGHWIWCLSLDMLYSLDKEGQPREILGTFFDSTELIQKQNEVEKLARDYASTFEQAAVGIAHVAEDGAFLKVNQRLCDIVGYSRNEMLNLRFQDITYAEDLGYNMVQFDALKKGELNNYILEKRYLHKDGHIIWVHVTVSFVHLEDEVPHTISVFEDITAKKETEFALEASNKELQQFAFAAAHDLKTPMRGIRQLSKWITEEFQKLSIDQKNPAYEYLDLLENRTKRMQILLDGFLEISRVGQGTQKLTTFNTEDVFHEIINLTNIEPGFSFYLAGDFPTIKSNHTAFYQTMMNLISNAIKHHDKATGRIDITYSRSALPHYHCFEITDDGPGIPPKFHEKIFGMLETLRPRDEVEGSGMGLSLVKKNVDFVRGKIQLISDPEKSRGASFVIFWPASNF